MLKTSAARLLTLCAMGILATGCVAVPDSGYYNTPTPVYSSGGIHHGPGVYAPDLYPTYPVYRSAPLLYRDHDDRRHWQQERERQAWREREQQQRRDEQRREQQQRDARQRDHRNDQARQQREREDARRHQHQLEQQQRDRQQRDHQRPQRPQRPEGGDGGF